MVDEVLALTFAGGKRLQNTLAATNGNVVTNLSPATGKRWIVERGEIYLDTDGNAANRYMILEITDGTNIIERLCRTGVIVANQVMWLTIGEILGGDLGADSLAVGRDDSGDKKYYLSIRPIVMEEADQLRITITNGVAGDQYSAFLVVREL